MYSDPYETWKEQGRPGGNYNAWLASQAPAQAPGPAPAPVAPQGPVPWSYNDWVANGSVPNPGGGPNYSISATIADRTRVDPRNNANAAQSFFSQQSPEDQAAILATWAPSYRIANGNVSMTFGGDRARSLHMQDWYRNAANAGSVPGYAGTSIRDLTAPPSYGPSQPPYDPYNPYGNPGR